MKLELVAVLVLCLALGEGSLLKFSLRGLNGVAKRGHGGGDAAKELASPGKREGGKEDMLAGGKEDGHLALGQRGETEEEEGNEEQNHGGKTDDDDNDNDSDNDSDNNSHNDSDNDSDNDSENDSHNDSHNDSDNDSHNDSDNDSNNDSNNDSDNDSDNDSHNDSDNDSHNDSDNDSHNDSHNDDEAAGSDLEDLAEQPCPTPEEFKAKLLEVIQGVKNYDGVIQGVASKAMDFVEGGDTTFEEVAESYGSVLEESGKTFGALEFVGHFMTCASTEGTEFARKACDKTIEFAQTEEYDPAEDEEYKRKMGEALLQDLECFDAEYDLAAALGEKELVGETALSKKHAIGLLTNFVMELEAYYSNEVEFYQAMRTAYYKIPGAVQPDAVQEQPDKRGMQSERELKQLLMDLLSKTKRHLRK